MKPIRLFALAVLSLALSTNQAGAQREDQFAWSAGVGPTFVGKDVHTTGYHADAALGIGMVDSPWGVRFEGLYSFLGDNSRLVTSPGGNTRTGQGHGKLFALTGNGVFNIYGSNTHLYAVGGLGGYWYNPDAAGTKAENDFMLQAGAGIWLGFANAFIEAKWQNLYRALPNPDTGVNGKKSMQLYPVTLGIIF